MKQDVNKTKHFPIALSGNQIQDMNRQRMAGVEAKNKEARLEAKKNLTNHQQERYVWCFPSEEEHGKYVIHGTPHIWEDNTCSWTMTNMINNATSRDAAAVTATAIASTVFDVQSPKKNRWNLVFEAWTIDSS